jgi:hypothetical protein
MRGRALPLVFVLLLSGMAQAQVTWQPTPPPLVTAENETWFRAGAPIEWNGEIYYPAGTPEGFNRYQMVRAGSYRGIPLYSDATLEPNSIVFVPIAGGRLQPYERPRTGMLAGTVGSRAPSFPVPASTEAPVALGVTAEGFVAQAPGPPAFARAYDLDASITGASAPLPTPSPAPPPLGVVATAGTTQSAPVGTSGRVTVTNRPSTAARPKGINGAWIQFDGRRWVSDGRAVGLTADFTTVGDYRGFPVYRRGSDTTTIYLVSVPGLVVPYKQK